jgi:hypothetical protein
MEDDLKGKSCSELSLMRNEIYAAHGYRFRYNKQIRQYFQNQPWYRDEGKTETQVVSQLNDYERYNRDFIRTYEKKRGCLQ